MGFSYLFPARAASDFEGHPNRSSAAQIASTPTWLGDESNAEADLRPELPHRSAQNVTNSETIADAFDFRIRPLKHPSR